MLIDTHCHLDMFKNPITMAKLYETNNIICIMATMLPSHYKVALPHLKLFKNIMPSLGMHPLKAIEGRNELKLFIEMVRFADHIGEIGMDLSAEGKKSKKLQIANLREILPRIRAGSFVSVHSRNAHEEISKLLDEYNVSPVCFHYFIGGRNAAIKLANKGHYFSINHSMLKNKQRDIIDFVPHDRILVESDGPFLTKSPLAMLEHIYDEIGGFWNTDKYSTEEIIAQNFSKCRTVKS